MLPQLTRNLPCVEPLDQGQIERIDHESMRILEEVGVDYRDPIALEQWRQAGARVDGQRVYADRGLIKELIKTIPKKLTLHARDPEKTVKLGGPNSIFVPMTGAPYMRDLNGVRRNPAIADLGTFHKLSHMLPAIHSSAHHIIEPMDLPVAYRHLHITYSSMKYSDKTFMGMTTSGKNAEDVIKMCAILFGDDYMETHPVVTGNVNGNSPLVWDETMLSALRAFAVKNQPILISPFVLGGANTPASTVP
ncbi:MAG: trimethylamine methyltransferase family protein, partial [Chloroflexota bacterium]